MNIFIVYATYSSGTEIASMAVEEYLTQKGNTLTLLKKLDEFLVWHSIGFIYPPIWRS
jgi:hypothetical protein